MSITNELREYVQGWRETPSLIDELDAGDIDGLLGDFEHIADRIDSEYEAKVSYWQGTSYKDGYDEGFASADDWLGQHEDAMAEHGWIRLPEDADGEYIHIGDVMEGEKIGGGYGEPFEVVGYVMMNGELEPMDEHRNPRKRKYSHHHHEPTVEDVLRDYACRILMAGCIDEEDKLVAEYAARLRLAGEDA